ETEGMGTTLSTMLFNGTDFGVCHVGDSRGYLLRDGKLEQITKDDTYVQSLVDKGELDPGDVSSHPQKSLILKAYTGR
ncbi:serine/threonine protein phosphatase, partial [Klebsiella pneumoniae]|nr:serine/threonine protein phosphatase [Klebsiella pneumoniae]